MVSYLRQREDKGVDGLVSFYSLSPLDANVLALLDDLDYLSDEHVASWVFAIKQDRYAPERPELPKELQKLARKEAYTASRLSEEGVLIPPGQNVYHYDKQSLIDHLNVRLDNDYGLWGQDIIDDFELLSPSEIQSRLKELALFDPLFNGLPSVDAPKSRTERDRLRFVEAQEQKIRDNQEGALAHIRYPRFKKKSSLLFRFLMWLRN